MKLYVVKVKDSEEYLAPYGDTVYVRSNALTTGLKAARYLAKVASVNGKQFVVEAL